VNVKVHDQHPPPAFQGWAKPTCEEPNPALYNTQKIKFSDSREPALSREETPELASHSTSEETGVWTPHTSSWDAVKFLIFPKQLVITSQKKTGQSVGWCPNIVYNIPTTISLSRKLPKQHPMWLYYEHPKNFAYFSYVKNPK
jgi:hypothetical protein